MQAGRRGCSTRTVTLWQPKECTRYKKTGTDSSQRTRKDKRTTDPSCKRAKGKFLWGIRGKNPPLTERVVTHWNKLPCYEISILGDSPGKGPKQLQRASKLHLTTKSAPLWLGLDQTTSCGPFQPKLFDDLISLSIWHSGFHNVDTDKGSLRCGKRSQLFCSRQQKQGIRLSKAEVVSAAQPKFFFLLMFALSSTTLKKDSMR